MKKSHIYHQIPWFVKLSLLFLVAATLTLTAHFVSYTAAKIAEEATDFTTISEGISVDNHRAEIIFKTGETLVIESSANTVLSLNDLNLSTTTTFASSSDAGVLTLTMPSTWAIGKASSGVLVRGPGQNSSITSGGVAGDVMLSTNGIITGSSSKFTFDITENTANVASGTKKYNLTSSGGTGTQSYVLSLDGLKTITDYFAFAGFNFDNYSPNARYSLRLAVGERRFSTDNRSDIEAAFSAIKRTLYPYVGHWENSTTTQSIYNQYLCHANWAADKVPWNLEPDRPATSYLSTVLARCNPT